MRVLVIGGGSIGRRHLRNLSTLGVEHLAVAEPVREIRAATAAEAGAREFGGLSDGLAWSPDVAVVATPNHLHVEHAAAALAHGCHLFVEKPLSHNGDGLEELSRAVEEAGVVSLVGCNMRFHHGPAKVKALLADNAIGRVLFQRIHTGSYLPGWRPWQDYRRSYSARAEMGGGCILDCIHEIDLARWYGGEVTDVFAIAGTTGTLEIDTEDYAALLLRHTDGRTSEVHLDYVSRTYERGCHIAGETGSVFWDYRAAEVRWYDATTDQWAIYPQPDDYDPNRMYVEEMRHFLSCVESESATVLPIGEAGKVMRVALAAKESARTGVFVSTAGAAAA